MRQYEAIVICSPHLAGDQLDQVKKAFGDMVQKSGGSLTETRELGKRAFGFSLKKEKEGNYLQCDFQLDPSKVSELKKTLALSDAFFRCSIFTKQPVPPARPAYQAREHQGFARPPVHSREHQSSPRPAAAGEARPSSVSGRPAASSRERQAPLKPQTPARP